ncbi:hypothetical protein, partial [Janthinobacterium sp.]|uniref:hypothetical protein n=1 Tax=Janthinobacterium sp. TaxID=1871054 RepID=UPI00293D59D6
MENGGGKASPPVHKPCGHKKTPHGGNAVQLRLDGILFWACKRPGLLLTYAAMLDDTLHFLANHLEAPDWRRLGEHLPV